MIAVSDVVLIVVSAVALGTGLFRWQNNLEQARQPTPTTQAVTTQSASSDNTQSSTTTPEATPNTQTSDEGETLPANVADQPANNESRVVDVEPVQTTSINVNDDGETTASNQAVTDAPAVAEYTVVPGDSLSQIAERFGTSVAILQDINNIQGSLINVGQQIRYPLPAN